MWGAVALQGSWASRTPRVVSQCHLHCALHDSNHAVICSNNIHHHQSHPYNRYFFNQCGPQPRSSYAKSIIVIRTNQLLFGIDTACNMRATYCAAPFSGKIKRFINNQFVYKNCVLYAADHFLFISFFFLSFFQLIDDASECAAWFMQLSGQCRESTEYAKTGQAVWLPQSQSQYEIYFSRSTRLQSLVRHGIWRLVW